MKARDRSDYVLHRSITGLAHRPLRAGASQAHRHGALSLRFAPCPEANPPLPSHGEARAVSPRLGGPMRTEPLDHESAAATGQPGFNHENACVGMVSPCCNAATRGESLSRDTRKPQNESVKKNLVIESCESTNESLRIIAARMLPKSKGCKLTGHALPSARTRFAASDNRAQAFAIAPFA